MHAKVGGNGGWPNVFTVILSILPVKGLVETVKEGLNNYIILKTFLC
jgi:hypothetical protein